MMDAPSVSGIVDALRYYDEMIQQAKDKIDGYSTRHTGKEFNGKIYGQLCDKLDTLLNERDEWWAGFAAARASLGACDSWGAE